CRAMQANDEAQEGRLARAIGPQQAEDTTGLDLQRDVVESDQAVVVDLCELVGLDDQFGCGVGHGASPREGSCRLRTIPPRPGRTNATLPPLPYTTPGACPIRGRGNGGRPV